MKGIFCIVWTKDGIQNLTKAQWYKFNTKKLHRLNGPAVEQANGSKFWFVNGKIHRLDGPAAEWSKGSKQWWVCGKRLDNKDIEQWLKDNKVDLKEPEGQMAFKLRWM